MIVRLTAVLLLSGCSTMAYTSPLISVTSANADQIIVITNKSSRILKLYYDYVYYFGELQMFYVRFRDKRGALLPVSGAKDGWFTPKLYHASLRFPPRKQLVLRPGQPVEFSRNVQHFVDWVRWDAPRDIAPCQVQFKLFGFENNDQTRPVEALSEWQPGPCPVSPMAGKPQTG